MVRGMKYELREYVDGGKSPFARWAHYKKERN
jgi:hypothetical protein